MNKTKRLLILLGCCIALCLSAWAVKRHYAPKAHIVPMEQGELIFSLGSTKTLSWIYEEQTISLDLTAEEWTFAHDPSCRLSYLSQSDILKAIENVHARRVIDEPGELSQYGLIPGACTITTDTGTLVIGDKAAVGGLCYVSVGDGKVYLVTETILYPFTRSPEQLTQ